MTMTIRVMKKIDIKTARDRTRQWQLGTEQDNDKKRHQEETDQDSARQDEIMTTADETRQ